MKVKGLSFLCKNGGCHVCYCCCRYAKSDRLRQLVNLVVVGGVIDPEDTGDREERDECVKMHNLIKEYKLQVRGAVRQT